MAGRSAKAIPVTKLRCCAWLHGLLKGPVASRPSGQQLPMDALATAVVTHSHSWLPNCSVSFLHESTVSGQPGLPAVQACARGAAGPAPVAACDVSSCFPMSASRVVREQPYTAVCSAGRFGSAQGRRARRKRIDHGDGGWVGCMPLRDTRRIC